MNNSKILGEGHTKWIYDILTKYYNRGSNPPEQMLEWRNKWFPKHEVGDVYCLVRTAASKLREDSKGRIQFRHNTLQQKWRFHEGLDDYLMLLLGAGKQLAGHLNTLNTDFGYGKTLAPTLEDEMVFIETPVIDIKKDKQLKLQQKYGS